METLPLYCDETVKLVRRLRIVIAGYGHPGFYLLTYSAPLFITTAIATVTEAL